MARLLEIEELPLRLTARGEWLHGDTPLHPKVAELFRRNIDLDEDGQYIVRLDFRRAPLLVEDTAFFVRSLRLRHDAGGGLLGAELALSDDRVVPLDFATLMQSADNVLYCQIEHRGWRIPCRFSSEQYHRLALCAESAEGEVFWSVGGARFRPQPYEPRPRR